MNKAKNEKVRRRSVQIARLRHLGQSLDNGDHPKKYELEN